MLFSPRSLYRRIALAVGVIGSLGWATVIVVLLYVQLSSLAFIQPVEGLKPHPDAVMILGAGLETSGVPSDVLVDRLIVGERVSKTLGAPMLLTGDGGRFREDEISAMSKWLLASGVSPDRLVIDDQGYRTYESCKRAAQVYHVKRVVLVTQRFHLGRALYLCRSFGLDAYGVPANIRSYKKNAWFVIRDVLASVKAWVDVVILPPASPVES